MPLLLPTSYALHGQVLSLLETARAQAQKGECLFGAGQCDLLCQLSSEDASLRAERQMSACFAKGLSTISPTLKSMMAHVPDLAKADECRENYKDGAGTCSSLLNQLFVTVPCKLLLPCILQSSVSESEVVQTRILQTVRLRRTRCRSISPRFFAQCRWLPALGCAKTRGCATALSSGLFSSKPRLNIEARGGPDARDLRLNKNNWDPRKIGKLDSRFIDPLKEPLSFL